MKKILMLAVLGLFVSAASGLAQTIYDGAKLTGKDLNGTARFVGMGGAMGALNCISVATMLPSSPITSLKYFSR